MKALFKKLGQARFGSKIAVSIVTILLLLGIGLSLTMHQLVLRSLLSENRVRGTSMAVNLAARATEPLLAVDYLQLRNLVDGAVKSDEDAVYAFVADQKGMPVVHTFSGGFPADLREVNSVGDREAHRVVRLAAGPREIYDFAAPIVIGTDRIGTVRIGLSLERVHQVVRQVTWTIVISITVAIALAGIVSTGLARTVTRKIRTLHQAAEEIIKGNLDIRAAQKGEANCWEVMKCDKKDCPAHGDISRRCWYLVGTLCASCGTGEYKTKIENCRECDVYKRNSGDEVQHLAEFFDVMAFTLKERLEELRTTETDLRMQQQLVQTILDATPDLVSLKDIRLRYRVVNKAFCEFVGKPETEIIGMRVADVFSPEQAIPASNEELQVMQTCQPVSVERPFKAPGGAQKLFHVVKTAVRDADGAVIGVLSTARDITEMRSLHERVAHAQRLESVGQLAAGVAHEINTPLGIILGYAQLSAEDVPAGSDLQENIMLIEKYARISKKIVADLLSFSRNSESVLQPLDMNELIGQIADIVEHTFGLDRIMVSRKLDPELPSVVGDREKLGQVIMNLLTNAHDAIGTDGTIAVASMYDSAAGDVVIAVSDTGPGIPSEYRERIFEPFFTTKGVGKGTGLGLSVTFGIVKEHGGRIDVVSPYPPQNPDNGSGGTGGTMVSIRLPIHQTQTLMQKEG